jgi:predicted PurR-regulated permease PerM
VRTVERNAFVVLLVVVSAAFLLVLWQFYGPILWGIAAAVVFGPFYRRLLHTMPGRRNLAATITLLVVLGLVILPATLIGIALTREVVKTYEMLQAGQLNLGGLLRNLYDALPGWAVGLLDRLGFTSADQLREQLSTALATGTETIATGALNVGQSAFGFFIGLGVMMYLTFFLLRDGNALSRRIGEAVPLPAEMRHRLYDKFLTVVRATIKGSFVVAAIQGAIGGLVLWALGVHAALLWGVLMAFLSLLPAVGAGFVWVPIALYLTFTGDVGKAIALTLAGLFIIGLVDNLLRPILVGKDARLPDYIVLISTLGGISLFGFNGIILGPLIAAMFLSAWDISVEERKVAEEGGKPPERIP